MKRVKHICTVTNRQSSDVSVSHLVKIDKDIFVFVFDKDGLIKRINRGDEYFYVGIKTGDQFYNEVKFKGLDKCKLSYRVRFTEEKLDDVMYLNYHTLHYKYVDLWNSYHDTLNILNKEVKDNTMILDFTL